MADREQPYDPYIPSGGAQGGAGAQAGGNQRTAALQAVRVSFRLIPTSRLPLDDARQPFAVLVAASATEAGHYCAEHPGSEQSRCCEK
jgi:hypothetical protein